MFILLFKGKKKILNILNKINEYQIPVFLKRNSVIPRNYNICNKFYDNLKIISQVNQNEMTPQTLHKKKTF